MDLERALKFQDFPDFLNLVQWFSIMSNTFFQGGGQKKIWGGIALPGYGPGTKCKAKLAVASFHNSSTQYLRLRGVLILVSSIFSKLSDSRVKIQIHFSLLETVLR